MTPGLAAVKCTDWLIDGKRILHLRQLPSRIDRSLPASLPFRIAKSLVALAETETEEGREAGCEFNLNKALDKEYETKSLAEVLMAPPSALQGLSPASDEHLKSLYIKTVEDLGTCKWAIWAESIVILAAFDSEKS